MNTNRTILSALTLACCIIALAASGAMADSPGISPAQAAQATKTQPQAAKKARAKPVHPYTLDTCAVAGTELGSMGDPVIKVYDGREVRFCCEGCVGKYEADPAKYNAELDKKQIKEQLIHYPLDTCLVAGNELGSMGDPINMMYNNRLVRFCCAGCVDKFKANPDEYLAQLDEKIIAQQVKTYPTTTCFLTNEPLDVIGKPINIVYMNRLVRVCCRMCARDFHANPADVMTKLDKAYADKQRDAYPLKTCVVADGELGSMGDAFELVAGTQLVRMCCGGCEGAFRADPHKYLAKIAAAASGK